MEHLFGTKVGRPREYTLEPPTGFASREVALAVAALDELRTRAIDQFEDLPQDGLAFAPEGTPITIAALAIHLAWAEKNWIRTITGCTVPADLDAALAPGNLLPDGEPVITAATAGELVALCRRVRDEVTYPALALLPDIDAVIEGKPQSMTPRGVLMHLIWHWTYHSAHIGLIRELWGSDYRWTFGSLGA